jgi:ABC-type nitrate/sulfonate/bicarbonate transport system permease component
MWSLIYLSGFPRLVEILYLNHLGLIGHSAPMLLGTLSVMCCVALSTKHALQDDMLRDQIEHAQLDAPTAVILTAIVIPQKRWNIATGWWLGTAAALSLTYFCEYMQSTSGVGYLLQMAFSGDVRTREALALTLVGMGILVCACSVVFILTRFVPEGMAWVMYRMWYGPRR